jgi:hypothetical protein
MYKAVVKEDKINRNSGEMGIYITNGFVWFPLYVLYFDFDVVT